MDTTSRENAEQLFRQDKEEYIRQTEGETKFLYDASCEWPILNDYKGHAGLVEPHYFFQDVYVAQQVAAYGLNHIFDIGSRLDGYISHLLAMRIRVTMIDIRPLPVQIEGLDFMQGNAMELSEIADNSIDALSCLHTIEHFGLGRYGDPIDYHGWEKAITQFKRVLRTGGTLFLSVPSGNVERVQFNAHRIFRPRTIAETCFPEMRLLEYTNILGPYRTTLNFRDGEESPEEICAYLDVYANEYMGEHDCGIYLLEKL